MNGDLQVAGVRTRPRTRRTSWSEWITSLRHKRQSARLERLEVIERLEAEARHSRKTGRHMSGRGHGRRWY